MTIKLDIPLADITKIEFHEAIDTDFDSDGDEVERRMIDDSFIRIHLSGYVFKTGPNDCHALRQSLENAGQTIEEI